MTIGRPREFDTEKALEAALEVFWRKGFEGATLPELTAAMGINRPSLYAAFGNKEALFRLAIERYVSEHATHIATAVTRPTAREVAQTLWQGTIELTTSPRGPRGCFLVQGALACGDEADGLRKEVAKRRAGLERVLAKRFTQAIDEGDLPTKSEPADLAKYVTTVSHGIAVQAAAGATREELRRVAEIAIEAWPR